MNYFAQILNNIVQQIVAVSNDIADGAQFCVNLYGGEWVETYMNTAGKNYAGIGYTYDAVNQNFISQQPYASWTLDSNDIWQPPTPQPLAPPPTHWNEQLQEWIPY